MSRSPCVVAGRQPDARVRLPACRAGARRTIAAGASADPCPQHRRPSSRRQRPARALGSARGARGDARQRPQHVARAARARHRRGGRRQDRARAALHRRARARRRGSCGARATRCSRRARWARCSTSPRRPAASWRRPRRATRGRTRWPTRCCASSLAAPRRSSSSRTCTGPTRPPSTSCGCWPGRRTRRPRSCSAPTATTSSTCATRCGSCSESWPRAQRHRALRAAAAVARGRRAARRAARHRRRRALPPHGGQPVLPLRGAGERRPRDPADRARRGPRPHGAPERGRRRRCWARSPCPSRRPSSGCSRRWPPTPQLACLDECLGSGMLTSTTDGVAFRHELARMTIEETLAPHRRAALHRDALAALVAPPAGAPDPARLAHHAEAAGDAAAVLEFAPAAAARADSVGAHRQAAAQYARALRFARRPAAGEARRAPRGPLPLRLPRRRLRRGDRGDARGARGPPGAGRSAARGRPDAPALGRPLLPRRPLRRGRSGSAATR